MTSRIASASTRRGSRPRRAAAPRGGEVERAQGQRGREHDGLREHQRAVARADQCVGAARVGPCQRRGARDQDQHRGDGQPREARHELGPARVHVGVASREAARDGELDEPAEPHRRGDLMKQGQDHQGRAMLETAGRVGEPGGAQRHQRRQHGHRRPATRARRRALEDAGGDGQGQSEGGASHAGVEVLGAREVAERVRSQRVHEPCRLEREQQRLARGQRDRAELEQPEAAPDQRRRGACRHASQHPEPPGDAAEGQAHAYQDGPAQEAVEEVGEDQHAALRRRREPDRARPPGVGAAAPRRRAR
jgi:hypothetical protein